MRKILLIPTIAAMAAAPLTVLSGCTIHLNPQPEPEPEPEDLCFEKDGSSNEDSTVSYLTEGEGAINIQTSYDGKIWDDWDGSSITLQTGKKLYVRNTENTLASSNRDFHFIILNGKVKASGNINSLINYGPLTDYCFANIFNGCLSLTQAPELPATELARGCYNQTFDSCSLKYAPELPATTLAPLCYLYMFNHCTSLIAAPKLQADTLVESCYCGMFNHCESLKVRDNNPSGATKIFTCPETGETSGVDDMFQYISDDSEFKGTPTPGNTYYWYTE